MTEAQVARIFDTFEQADASTARRFGGSGLGMTIVRRLVDLMQGEISVQSEPERGTRIVITLRVPIDPETSSAPKAPTIQIANGTRPFAITPGTQVLVVDDNPTNQQVLEMLLRQSGAEVALASNGVEALASWRSSVFDIILLDISMPVMSGPEALQNMLTEAASSGRPVPYMVAATANVMTDQLEDYRRQGFADILPKPVLRAQLEAVLERAEKARRITTIAAPASAKG
jgi:CheY-like chemotaxis protein